MYTNWPFTAKTNTHTIHMSEINQRSLTSAPRVLTLCMSRSNLQGGDLFSSPNLARK